VAYSGPWRVAKSLDVLLGQINAQAPTRSKASDGSIADDAHSKSSDHYPKVLPGLGSTPTVTARDFTHDPADGADMNVIAERLRRSKDRRIKYVIWNRRIFSGSAGPQPWVWRGYDGDNPHDKHMHVSADASAVADDTDRWDIGEEDPMANVRQADWDALIWRIDAVANGRATVAGGPTKGSPVALNINLTTLGKKVDALATAVAGVDEAAAVALRAQFDEIDAAQQATLAAIDQAAAADAVRDAELRELVEAALSGEQDAQVVLRLIADKLRDAAASTSDTPTSAQPQA
jgi:hypothetical protein